MGEAAWIWAGAAAVSAAVFLPALFAFRHRRHRDRERFAEATRLGIHRPVAQYPFVDRQRCIGCAACVTACPEGDVLGIVSGVAVVINGLRCVGHALCEEACPVDGIEVGLGNLDRREDIPLLDAYHESSLPGLFITGELGGLALIRNAVEQGRRAAHRIAERVRGRARSGADGALDLLIVGAGPSGLSAALAARERGLSCAVLEQEGSLGGTILHYPRRKLVLTRPVELPLYGWLQREEYEKEELLARLEEAVERFELPVRFGHKVEAVNATPAGFVARTPGGSFTAHSTVLAMGRRGTPRRLGVPGEELPKVMYQLRDAGSYRRRHLLCVGGGDSAVEAAMGLARQPGNTVTLSYRKEGFFRIKKKNLERLERLLAEGRLQALMSSRVVAIEPDRVHLQADGRPVTLPNDYVFVFIGGEPPFPFLKQLGVRFGGAQAPEPEERSSSVHPRP